MVAQEKDFQWWMSRGQFYALSATRSLLGVLLTALLMHGLASLLATAGLSGSDSWIGRAVAFWMAPTMPAVVQFLLRGIIAAPVYVLFLLLRSAFDRLRYSFAKDLALIRTLLVFDPQMALARQRLVLEKAVLQLTEPMRADVGANLHDAIRALTQLKKLPSEYARLAHSLRIAGNAAVHPHGNEWEGQLSSSEALQLSLKHKRDLKQFLRWHRRSGRKQPMTSGEWDLIRPLFTSASPGNGGGEPDVSRPRLGTEQGGARPRSGGKHRESSSPNRRASRAGAISRKRAAASPSETSGNPPPKQPSRAAKLLLGAAIVGVFAFALYNGPWRLDQADSPSAASTSPAASGPAQARTGSVSRPGTMGFADATLEQVVRQQAGFDGTTPLSPADVAQITHLDIEGLGVMSLDGIEHLTGLQELHAARNKITSTEPLAELDRLTFADLSFNEIPMVETWLREASWSGKDDDEPGGLYLHDDPTQSPILLTGNPLDDSRCVSRDEFEVCLYELRTSFLPINSTVFRVKGEPVVIDSAWDGIGQNFLMDPPIQDVTGDGKLNVGIEVYGMTGWTAWYLYELEPPHRLLLRDTVARGTRIEDVDGDGVPEFVLRNYESARWDISVPVILRFQDGEYGPVLRPAPTREELHVRAARLADESWEREEDMASLYGMPQAVRDAMAELIFSGHWEDAFYLAELVWPEEHRDWQADALVWWFAIVPGEDKVPPPPAHLKAQWRARADR